MGSIKRGGLALAGGVAGMILAVSGIGLAVVADLPGLLDGAIEGRSPNLVLPLVMRAATGLLLAWVYVAFRPRFGGGRRAIVGAAVAVWGVTAAVVVSAAALVPALPALTVALVVVWSLIDLTVASYAAAVVYRRHVARSTRRRGRTLEGESIV